MRAVESVQEFAPDMQEATVRKALSFSIWDGIFANLHANLTGGVFLVGYALALKATEVQIGLLAAFPLIANVAQVFFTYVIELIGRRRPLALWAGTFARLLWLMIIGAALWGLQRKHLLYLSMWVIGLSQIGIATNIAVLTVVASAFLALGAWSFSRIQV